MAKYVAVLVLYKKVGFLPRGMLLLFGFFFSVCLLNIVCRLERR